MGLPEDLSREIREGSPAQGLGTTEVEILRRLYVNFPPSPYDELMGPDELDPTLEYYRSVRDAIDEDSDLLPTEKYALQSEWFQRWASIVDGETRNDDAYLWIKE